MSENQTNVSTRQEESLNIKDLISLYLSKWKWFVLSLAVCLGVAVLYLLKSPSVYTRTATLLIEDNDKGGSISASEMSFADLGLFQSNTNVNNEIIAMSSPALMQDVVRRLHLDNCLYRWPLTVSPMESPRPSRCVSTHPAPSASMISGQF